MAEGEKHPDRAAAIRAGLQRALAACDASYLWLARHLEAELVTLDRDLAVAADSL